jgi:uncharacterized protein (TIGR00290 family)
VTRPRALVCWSSGKDAAWALHVVRARGESEVVGLLTTLAESHGRVTMHGVREALLEAQASAAGLPLTKVFIPEPCPHELYEDKMRSAMQLAIAAGATRVVFGDLFLRDVREYREAQLARVGLQAVFPLWGQDTAALARRMLAGGLCARLTCLDPRVMPRGLAGAEFGEEFLERLPAGVDPCGERGEFHTCCLAGPMFARPIAVRVGPTVERGGFVFTDLEPHPAPGDFPEADS